MCLTPDLEAAMQVMDNWTQQTNQFYTVNVGSTVLLNGESVATSNLKKGDFIGVRYPVSQEGGEITPSIVRATNRNGPVAVVSAGMAEYLRAAPSHSVAIPHAAPFAFTLSGRQIRRRYAQRPTRCGAQILIGEEHTYRKLPRIR